MDPMIVEVEAHQRGFELQYKSSDDSLEAVEGLEALHELQTNRDSFQLGAQITAYDAENQVSAHDLSSNSSSAKSSEQFNVIQNEHEMEEGVELSDVTGEFTTDTIFESREELLSWAKQRGKEVGMVVIIKKSDLSTGRAPRTLLACERQGKYKPRKKKQDEMERQVVERGRKATKRSDCPFLLRGVCVPGSRDRWTVKVECGRHNHALATYNVGHSFAGRLTSEEKNLVYEMTKSGMKPKSALSLLKDRDPKNASTLQTVYNARKRIRFEERLERTQLQQLMLLMDQHGYIQHTRRDNETNEVKNLFWAHPDSIRLAQCFPHVFLMDAAYKSNRYKWPLFEIVGVTSTMMTFPVCYCLMEHEYQVDYTWCLERFLELLDGAVPGLFVTNEEGSLIASLDPVFPETNKFPETKKFLCRERISMGVKEKARSDLPDRDLQSKYEDMWNNIVHAATIDEFDIRMAEMVASFSCFPRVITYLQETWLPYKERFVAAWTNQFLHFGNTNTNKAEGTHASLKEYLVNTSQYDFLTMWNMIHSALSVQMTEIIASFEKSINVISHEFKVPMLADVRGSVSSIAMRLLAEETNRCDEIGTDMIKCGCSLRRTHGLPCAHELSEISLKNGRLCLDQIHNFWKKLTAVPTRVYHSDLDLHEEYTIFVQRYERSTIEERKYLLQRLKDLAYQL